MKKVITLTIIGLVCTFLNCNQTHTQNANGHLMIIGGGKRPTAVMQKFVELSGGSDARIAIIPMASSYYKEAGERYTKEFLELGVAEAKPFYLMDKQQANADSVVNALVKYTGIYFGGGDQRKLPKIFLNTRSLDLFRQKYREGAAIGGTSAGAAIMSEIMITGDGSWTVPEIDSVDTKPGLGFLQSVIIDQHFFARRRLNRLLAVSIENRKMGIGIDESTAIWVKPDRTVEILGESVVIVIDPSKAQIPQEFPENLLTAQNLRMDILHAGQSFNLPD